MNRPRISQAAGGFQIGVRGYLFLVIAASAALPVAIAGGVHAHRWTKADVSTTDRLALAVANSLSQQLAQEMLGHVRTVEVLAAQIQSSGVADRERMHTVVRTHAMAHPESTGVLVLDPQGVSLAAVDSTTGRSWTTGIAYGDRDYFRRVRASLRTVVSPRVTIGRLTGILNIHLAAPAIDRDGALMAVVVSSVDVGLINSEARAVAPGLGDDGRLVVVDAEGRLIADSDAPADAGARKRLATAAGSSPLLRDVSAYPIFGASTTQRELRLGVDDRGRPVRAGVVAVDFDGLGWRIVALRSVASIQHQGALVRLETLLFTVAALIAALGIAALAAAWLARPVRALAKHAERVARGDLGPPPEPQRDGPREMVTLTNAVREMIQRLGAHAENLERTVEERTRQLTQRGRDMRLVLDNVAQGFLTIDAKGHLAQERSAIVDRWFGPYSGEGTFADYVGTLDRQFGDMFQIAHEAYLEGYLPRALCLDQLPTSLKYRTRTFSCSYSPLDETTSHGGLLIVMSDVTEQLVRAEKEIEQRDLMALFEGLMRDRSGYLAFFEEAGRLIESVKRATTDVGEVRRLLHTLKGNAGAVNLYALAALCHQAEEGLEETRTIELDGRLGKMCGHWQSLSQTVHALFGERASGTLEIDSAEIERISDDIRSGASSAAVLEALVYVSREPAERALDRLAKYACELGRRLGKGDLAVEIDGHGVRLDARRWAPLWSEMGHLVRNAIDHGFETPDQRRLLGKLTRPCLRLETTVAERRFIVKICDDGRGIDWTDVRRTALQRGLPCQSQRDLAAALFSPAFTTRSDVTVTSGRGIGLAAALECVRLMGGTIDVDSQAGRGSCWTISLPSSSPSGPASALARPRAIGRFLDEAAAAPPASAGTGASSVSPKW